MFKDILSRFLHVRTILRENKLRYLIRYSIREQTEENQDAAWRIFLHNFLTIDEDGQHNHPWKWSVSFIPRGSYTEEYFDLITDDQGTRRTVIKTRRVRWFNFIRANHYHRIIELHGDVWTVFFTGPLSGRDWGFWDDLRGHVSWKQHYKERDEKCRTSSTLK